MTLLEAIKKAEEKQKALGENTTKVYIHRKGWKNVVDPVDFMMCSTSTLPFHKINMKFNPSKNDIINNNWELFYSLPEAENKDNKNSNPESTSISKENITNVIEQIALIKKELNELSKDTAKIIKMFEDKYGISIDCLVKNPKILVDKESAILYLFAELTKVLTKNINTHLNKAIIELDRTEQHKNEK